MYKCDYKTHEEEAPTLSGKPKATYTAQQLDSIYLYELFSLYGPA